MTRLLFKAAMRRVSPPWLQRFVGGAFMESLGVPVDTLVDNTSDGVKLRFPDAINPEALAFIGRERRILRGPGEAGSTFAVRMLRWWDAHRTRGGPFELLRQLFEFFLESNNVPIDLVANSGLLHSLDTAGAITRSTIPGWTGDGEYPLKWARFFLFINLTGTTFASSLFTEGGEPMFTEGGDSLLADVSIYVLTAEDEDIICSVPREWNAAHIERIYIDLIPINGIAWGYPPGIEWGDVGLTWGGGLAVQFIC